MNTFEFVKDSEEIVMLLHKMAIRGLENPVKSQHKWDSVNVIKVSPEEKKIIGLYVITHRSILNKAGIQEIGNMFGDGPMKSFATSVKLLCLSSDETSPSYCMTLMDEIEEAVSEYISQKIGG